VHIRRLIPRLAAALLLAALSSCSSHPTSGTVGHVDVRLTDAPGDYEQVNLVVTGVSIHRGDDEDSGGWESLTLDSTTVFDLLELRNGVFAQLAEGDVPAGHYTQVRLLLGAGSNVVVGGTTYPLTVPSGMQSGYKLVGEFDVPAGGGVELTLDFDAARSIHRTGNGRYMLQPTVRVIVNQVATTGNIIGHLLPEGVAATAYAISGPDTVQTTVAGPDGRFDLAALLAGSYTVAIHPDAGHRDTTIADVAVTAGSTTDLGDIELSPSTAATARLVGSR